MNTHRIALAMAVALVATPALAAFDITKATPWHVYETTQTPDAVRDCMITKFSYMISPYRGGWLLRIPYADYAGTTILTTDTGSRIELFGKHKINTRGDAIRLKKCGIEMPAT